MPLNRWGVSALTVSSLAPVTRAAAMGSWTCSLRRYQTLDYFPASRKKRKSVTRKQTKRDTRSCCTRRNVVAVEGRPLRHVNDMVLVHSPGVSVDSNRLGNFGRGRGNSRLEGSLLVCFLACSAITLVVSTWIVFPRCSDNVASSS